MRKTTKKLASVLLVLALCAGSLAACSSGNNNTSGKGAASSAASNSVAEENTGEIPHYKIIATLNTATEDLNENPFYQQLAKDAGIEVEYECINSGWGEKRAALLASNDLPDAFIGWQVLTQSDVANNQPLFANLGEMITEENTPNLKAFIDSDSDFRDACTDVNGNLYYLSDQALFRPSTYYSILMNTQWLNKLNLKVPTTLDEFEKVLVAFRDQDPNGNGEADEIPIYGSYANILRGSFDVQNSLNYDYLRQENGQVVFLPTKDNWKELMKYSHHLLEEGLIPEETITADWAQQSARLGTEIPTVGVTTAWIKDPINIEYQDQYEAIAPLKGPDGAQYIAGNLIYSTYDGQPKFVMSANCENKEALMRFVDSFFIPENSAQLSRGPIGLTLTKNDDGTLTINDPPEGMDWDTWLYKYALKDSIPTIGGDTVESLFTGPNGDYLIKQGYDEMYQPYINWDINLPTLKFTEDESAEMSMIQTDVNDFVATTCATWFVNGGIDEGWDSYLAELENMGLSRLIEIYQAAYDRTK